MFSKLIDFYQERFVELTSSVIVYGYVLIIVALIGECITVSSFTKTGDHRAAAAAVFFLFFFVVM